MLGLAMFGKVVKSKLFLAAYKIILPSIVRPTKKGGCVGSDQMQPKSFLNFFNQTHFKTLQ